MPTWYQPGIDITVSDASLDNALSRARQPDDPRPAESREGNLEGAFSISFTMTDTNFHELVFPESTNTSLATSAQAAPTATWYIEADTLTATPDRFLQGAAVSDVTWNYTQGEDVTVDLTIIYGDEDDGTNLSEPGSISQPSASNCVPFHGMNFDLNATDVAKLQSLTLDIAGMARFRRGPQRSPVDAVVGAYEPSLSWQAILEDQTYQQIAYGSTTANTPVEDVIEKQSATVELSNTNGVLTTYNVSGIQPTTYSWESLVAADEDITDPVEAHVNDIAVA